MNGQHISLFANSLWTHARRAEDGGGYSISYIPWESQLSGEVGGYPQALMKVVNLQGMLDFRRNFHLSKHFQK